MGRADGSLVTSPPLHRIYTILFKAAGGVLQTPPFKLRIFNPVNKLNIHQPPLLQDFILWSIKYISLFLGQEITVTAVPLI